MSNTKVPFVDLFAQYQSIKNEVDTEIQAVLNNTDFIGGKRVADFESEFAEIQNAKHCIAVANGTDAIYIALKMLGINAEDEVITVANSWISTAETISQTGAKPVFVDIDETCNIDTSLIKDAITAKTKAIIPVHLYGQPANMHEIKNICDENNLFLIEDCAQAHLAEYNNTKVGNFGNAGTFSFYPGKNLGAYGDAGAIVTNDSSLAEKCRMYARHGALKKHNHQIEGINSRMDSMQAAILSVKLPHLEGWTKARQKAADLYRTYLNDVKAIQLPLLGANRSHVYHLFVIRTPLRDQLKHYLQDNGIETAIHYPTALPLLPAYQHLNHTTDDFPVAARHQNEILSLPIFPEITKKQIEHVSQTIKRFFNKDS